VVPILASSADFPAWVRATHWINVLLLGLLVRSGLQILGAYPRFYLDDHCQPGSEWLKFTGRKIPPGRWTSLEQETEVPAWLGQPGGNNLGLGRHWHFFAVVFWVLNGAVYLVLMVTSGTWDRLLPASLDAFPDAAATLGTYLTLHKPPAGDFTPFDPLQKLAYAAGVFVLAPLLILTGAAQSPALEASVPALSRAFGGRQTARSLHFAGLIAFVVFTAVHTALVAYTGLATNLRHITVDAAGSGAIPIAVTLVLAGAIELAYVITSGLSRARPRRAQALLGAVYEPLLRALARTARERKQLPPDAISPSLIVNGLAPEDEAYARQVREGFGSWRIEVTGLVRRPLCLSLADLSRLDRSSQTTRHHCVQGWSGIAEWTGTRVSAVLAAAQPLPQARYALFYSHRPDDSGDAFYESLELGIARQPETIIATGMNGAPLTPDHGAPARLRVETQLGYKMVKWLTRIELVEDYHNVRGGLGGSREDLMYYEQAASM
jgi:sulfoxide reductase catalytic subunit YedY